MPNHCYGYFGHTPSRPRRGEHEAIASLSRVPAPVSEVPNPYPTAVQTPPAGVRHLYRYRGPLWTFIENIRDLCSLNRRRIIETYRAQQVIGWGRAASALGRMLVVYGQLAEGSSLPSFPNQRPPGFGQRCDMLTQTLSRIDPLNPLPTTNRRLYDQVGQAAERVRAALVGNEIGGELEIMLRTDGASPWTAAVLLRVADTISLAIHEVEITQSQHQLAHDLDNILRNRAGSSLETVAGYIENTQKGAEMIGHAAAAAARYHLLRLANNGPAAARLADDYIARWAAMLEGVEARTVQQALMSGDRAQVEGVQSELRRSGFNESTGLGRMASALGFVQALYVIYRAADGQTAQAGLQGVQDLLATGEAFTTVTRATFALLGASGTRSVSAEGVARLFRATGEVVSHVGTALSLAGAAFAIVQGLDNISTGWRGGTNVDVRRVASGVLEVSSGVLLIVGVLASSPGTQALAIAVGLIALGIEATRPEEPFDKQIMQSLLESIDGRRTIAERLGIATQVQELLDYTRGVDARGQGFPEPWLYWTPSEVASTLPEVQRHAIGVAWRMLLKDAGFSEDMTHRLLPVSPR